MKKKKLQALDTIKFIDIDKSEVTKGAAHYFFNYYITYYDKVLQEHLIDIHSAAEDIPVNFSGLKSPYQKELIKEIRTIAKLANKHDAAYIRFITP